MNRRNLHFGKGRAHIAVSSSHNWCLRTRLDNYTRNSHSGSYKNHHFGKGSYNIRRYQTNSWDPPNQPRTYKTLLQVFGYTDHHCDIPSHSDRSPFSFQFHKVYRKSQSDTSSGTSRQCLNRCHCLSTCCARSCPKCSCCRSDPNSRTCKDRRCPKSFAHILMYPLGHSHRLSKADTRTSRNHHQSQAYKYRRVF